ncbi:MAG TPA: DUF4232 domain-containing protein [Sphingobium sp.]
MLPLLALSLTAAPALSTASRLPPCSADQLSLAFDGEGGAFNGMSHGGTLLVIRNLGPKACRMPGLPRLSFRDADGKPLPIVRKAPRGMHPGPVVVPVGVAAGAELTAPLRWVSGEVYDRSQCLTVASVAVQVAAGPVGTGTLQGGFAARICGEAGSEVEFDQPGLRADPRL